MAVKLSNSARNAVSTCAAVAILTGCSSTANFMQLGTPASLHSDSRIGKETLNGKHYSYICKGTGHSLTYKVVFTARGKVTGPFPGTFTASGRYKFRAPVSGGNTLLSFNELFTIKSGKRTLTGHIYRVRDGSDATCTLVDSDDGFRVKYGVSDGNGGKWSGPATAFINNPYFVMTLQ